MKTTRLPLVLCMITASVLSGVSSTSWNQWGDWTPCTTTCGFGVQTRYRACNGNIYYCKGKYKEQQECLKEICPGNIVEGDIVIKKKKLEMYSVAGDSDTWTPRTIPFELEITSANAKSDVWTNIRRAMMEIMKSMTANRKNNCINFVKRGDSHKDYIKITNRINQGCYSSVGRRGGMQLINIDDSCKSVGIILHELLHALGFWHEHSRSDRDTFINVIYGNIREGAAYQFKTQTGNTAMEKAIPYDYGSILHYKHDEYARTPGIDTLVPKKKYDKYRLGQRDRLSDIDVRRLAWLYRCNEYLVETCKRPLITPKVAPYKEEYAVGEMITYSCGFRSFLIGPKASLCKDDGQWEGAVPVCLTSNPKYYYPLDFENGLADPFKRRTWTKTNTFILNSGQTPSRDTGPHTDNTYQNSSGTYLYLEATKLPTGTTAQLQYSPVYTGSCTGILFFYNMYGTAMGELTVTMCRYNIICQQIASLKTSTSDNKWRMFKKQLSTKPNEYYKIKIEAKRGNGDTSDIAIDDVFIGTCDDVNIYANAQASDNKADDEIDGPNFDSPYTG